MPGKFIEALMGTQTDPKKKKKKPAPEEQDILESLMAEEETAEATPEDPEDTPAEEPGAVQEGPPQTQPLDTPEAVQMPQPPKGDGLGDRDNPGGFFDYTEPGLDEESDWMKKGTKKRAAK